MTTAAVTSSRTRLRVEGLIDFDNAEAICAEGLAQLRSAASIDGVDLARLEHAGSVLIAVLLVWAETRAQPLLLTTLPSSLRRVLEFTGMDELFVLADDAAVDAGVSVVVDA